MTCNHVRRGRVTNQTGPYDPSRAHASVAVCDRPECIREGQRYVAGETNETAHYVPDPPRDSTLGGRTPLLTGSNSGPGLFAPPVSDGDEGCSHCGVWAQESCITPGGATRSDHAARKRARTSPTTT